MSGLSRQVWLLCKINLSLSYLRHHELGILQGACSACGVTCVGTLSCRKSFFRVLFYFIRLSIYFLHERAVSYDLSKSSLPCSCKLVLSYSLYKLVCFTSTCSERILFRILSMYISAFFSFYFLGRREGRGLDIHTYTDCMREKRERRERISVISFLFAVRIHTQSTVRLLYVAFI